MPPLDLSRLPPAPVTRFAPSPTGLLHLGHVANAVWTWGVAGAAGGKVQLRIEDHDRGRSRTEYERAILDDLNWLGLIPDAASAASLARYPSEFRQSDCHSVYQAALDELRAGGTVYACRCSRAAIGRRMAAAGRPAGDEVLYDGTCRHLGLPISGASAVRLAVGDAEITFHDIRLGPQTQRPAEQCGDVLLRDALQNWTYQWCVAVDDMRHGVTLVVRGEDLLPSTGRQILLARLLGRETPPAWLHHPLVTDAEGRKLSKREEATGIRELRLAGRTPAEVLGMAAHRTGLQPEPAPLLAEELASLFR
jgi:glutamyl-tRNA synthetase/glutamyl-Q tRNA(Asp) synthetase